MHHQLYPTCTCIVILLLILGAAAPAAATDWGVNTTHYQELPSGPSYASAAPIQGAIDAAATGDTITVEYGVYDESVTVADKDIIITGTPSGGDLPVLYESSGTASALVSFTNTSPSFGGFVLENNVSTEYGIDIAIARNVTLHNVTADGFDISAINISQASGTMLLEDICATGSKTGPNIAMDTLSGRALTDTGTLRSVTASGALAGEGITIEMATLPVSFENVTTTANALTNIRITYAGSPDGYDTFTFSHLTSTGSHNGNGLVITLCRGPLIIRDANFSANRGTGVSIEFCGIDNTSIPATTTFSNVTASDSIAGYGITVHECRGLLTLTNVTAERNHGVNIYLDEVGRSGTAETILTGITASESAAGGGIRVGSSLAPVTLDNVTATGNSLQNIWLVSIHDEATFRTVTATDSAASRGIEIGYCSGPLFLSGTTASDNYLTGIDIYTESPALTLQEVTAERNGLSLPAGTSFNESGGLRITAAAPTAMTLGDIRTNANRGAGIFLEGEIGTITTLNVSASENLIGALFSCQSGVFADLTTSANTFAGMMFDKEASGIVMTDSTANDNPFGIMMGGAGLAGGAENTYDVGEFMNTTNYWNALEDASGCENITLRDCTAQDNTLWDVWVAPVASMADITVEDLSTLPETTVSHTFSPSGYGLMMSGRPSSTVPPLPAGASSNQFLLLAATDASLEYSLNTPLVFTVPGLSAGNDNSIWTSTGGAWAYWPGGGVRDIPNATISISGLDLTVAGTYVSPLTGAAVPTPPPGPESDSDSYDYPPVTPTFVATEAPEGNVTGVPPEDVGAGGEGTDEGTDATGPTPVPTAGAGAGPTEGPGTSGDDATPAATTPVTPTTAPFAWAGLPVALAAAVLLTRRR